MSGRRHSKQPLTLQTFGSFIPSSFHPATMLTWPPVPPGGGGGLSQLPPPAPLGGGRSRTKTVVVMPVIQFMLLLPRIMEAWQ